MKKWYQAGALLLVVLFLCISAIQAFHSDASVLHPEHTEGKDYVAATEKCAICDYYAHYQGKEFYLSYPLVLVVPIPDAITLNTNVFVGNYKFTLQGFTNKGPPAFSC